MTKEFLALKRQSVDILEKALCHQNRSLPHFFQKQCLHLATHHCRLVRRGRDTKRNAWKRPRRHCE